MTVGENTGGLPYILRETFTTTGRKVDLKINPKWLCVRVNSSPCKLYFTQEDFDNDENYIGIPIPSDTCPYGEWKSNIDSNYIWIRGYDGSTEVELVCSKSSALCYEDEGGGGSAVLTLTATITTTDTAFVSKWYGTNGSELLFDWYGDGSVTTPITLLGSGTPVNANYTYPSSAEKTMKITGDFLDVTRDDINSQLVSATNFAVFKNMDNHSAWGNPITSISDLAGLVLITRLSLGSCSITDISVLANMTGMTHLYINNNNFTDISPIADLTSLISFFASETAITYPLTGITWGTRVSGVYHFESTVDSSDEVDRWLIDLAAANWSNCLIYLDGTNPAPTAAAASALATLAGNGCTVYTN